MKERKKKVVHLSLFRSRMLRRAAPPPARPPSRPLAVGAGDAEMRLDRFVRAQVPSLPQSLIQRWTRTKTISLSEPGLPPRKTTAAERLRPGWIVHVPAKIESTDPTPRSKRSAVRFPFHRVCVASPEVTSLLLMTGRHLKRRCESPSKGNHLSRQRDHRPE
jgi:hypothetical protein